MTQIKIPAYQLLKYKKKSKEYTHLKKRVLDIMPIHYMYIMKNTRKVRKLLNETSKTKR